MALAKAVKITKRRKFLAKTPKLGPKSKPGPLADLEVSPYYWWWQYLRRNSLYIRCCNQGGKGKCAALYRDFGDVRSDDFREWWYGKLDRGAVLFAEPLIDFYIKSLTKPDELNDLSTDSDVAVVAVNLQLVSRREIKKQFDKWLALVKAGKPGKPDVSRSNARYPLYRNFSSKNLKRILVVYDAVEKANAEHQRGEPRKNHAEIGRELKLIKWAIAKDASNNRLGVDPNRSLGNVVSRLYVKGKRIIENTAYGVFPKE